MPSFVEIGPPVPEKILEEFSPYMGVAAIFRLSFPYSMRLHIKFGFDVLSGFRGEDV